MSSPLLIKANAVILDKVIRNTSVTVSDGQFSGVGNLTAESEVIDCRDLILFPGFVDIHIHGAMGVDVNAADTDGLFKIARFLAANGVTAWMPTLVPDSDENYRRAIAAIDQLMKTQAGEPIAQAVGVHYEGVFASEKMCGALRAEFFKKFTGTELGQLPRLTTGVHMMTFAPEIEGGVELAKELSKQGWVASIGHTSAGVETLDEAYSAGARHITHFFNAMTGLHHRHLGVVGWAFANQGVTFDIIADGIHVRPEMLEFACRAKSAEHVSLISDSVAPTGLGDGELHIWGEKITVEDGRTQNERGSIAGSVITMRDAAMRMRSLGFSDAEVSRMASLNPSKLLGLDRTHGSIEIGKRADLIAVDDKGNLKLTIIRGRVVHNAL